MERYLKYIGIEYKDMGRDHSGLDCWGLVRLIMQEQLHITLPSYDYDNNDPESLDILISTNRRNEWVAVDEPEHGDVVVLRQLGAASHIGFMVDSRMFIHASVSSGVVAADVKDRNWSRRIEGYYRHYSLCSVRLICQESLFKNSSEQKVFEPGITISEIIDSCSALKWKEFAHVTVHGEYIPEEIWEHTTVKRGALVNITLVPKKNSGLLNMILGLAVLALAPGPGHFIGKLLHVGSTIGRGIAGIIGMLLVNNLCPPPNQSLLSDTSGTDVSNLYSITGPSNRINQYGVVPVVLGQHKQVPPYAAKPYTSIVGNDVYLHAIFLIGYGPLYTQLPKLGETALSSYPDLEFDVQDGSSAYVQSPLAPSNVDEESVGITLNYDDGYQSRTTSVDTDEISLDLAFPGGLCVVNDDGSLNTRRVIVHAEYKEVSSGTYLPFMGSHLNNPTINAVGSGYTTGVHALVFTGGGGTGAAGTVTVNLFQNTLAKITMTSYGNGYTSAPAITFPTAGAGTGGSITVTIINGHIFEGKTRQPFRHNFTLRLPAQGQYDFRIKRSSEEYEGAKSAQYIEAVGWTTFRSVSYNPVIIPKENICVYTMKVKATDSLNGQIQNFNVTAQSKGKGWNPSTKVWVDDQLINSCGDIMRLWLQGPWRETPSTDAEIDLDKLADWNDFCYSSYNGFSFNYVVDTKRTVGDIVKLIAASGRAVYSRNDNKHSVVIDEQQTLPVQIYTVKNSSNLRTTRNFFTTPDCIRVKFIDKDSNWVQQEEPVYNDGKNATNSEIFTKMEWPGVTDAAQLWKLTRYQLGCAITRQMEIHLDSGFEYLGVARGKLIHIANDIIKVGLAAGRVQTVTASQITVDETCVMETGESYSVQVRKQDGTITTWPLLTVAGSNLTLTRTGVVDFDCDPEDLFAFGITGQTSKSCLVKNIVTKADLGATLICIPYDDSVYTMGAGAAPAWSPEITALPSTIAPDPPRTLLANEYMYSEEGSLVQGVSLTWIPPVNTIVTSYELQLYYPNDSQWKVIYNGQNPFYDFRNCSPGTYSFRVRARRDLLSSTWVTLADEVIDSLAANAADVMNFRLIFRDNMATLVWDVVKDIRPVVYEIRNGTTGWDEAVVILTTGELSYQPLLRGTYLIKAKAYAGYSINAASLSIAGEDLPVNVVQEISENDEEWDGTFSNCSPVEPEVMTKAYNPLDGSEPDSDGWTLGGTDYASLEASDAYLLIDPSGLSRYSYDGLAGDCLFFEATINSLDVDKNAYIELTRLDSDASDNRIRVYFGTGTLASFVTDLVSSTNHSLGALGTYRPTKVTIFIIKDYLWLYVDDVLALSTSLGAETVGGTVTRCYWGCDNNAASLGDIEWYGVDFYCGPIEGVRFYASTSQLEGIYTTNESNILDLGSDKNVLIQAPSVDWLVTEGSGSIIPELRVRRDGRDAQYLVRESAAVYDITDVAVNCGTTGYPIDFDIIYTEDSTASLTAGVDSLIPDLTWTTVQEVRGEDWSSGAGEKVYTLDAVIPVGATWGIRSYSENGTPAILEISGHVSPTSERVDGKLSSYSTSLAWVSSATSVTGSNAAWRAFSTFGTYYWQASVLAATTTQVLTHKFPTPRWCDRIRIFKESTIAGSEPEDYIIEVEEGGSWVAVATITGQTWVGFLQTHDFTAKIITGYRISISATVDPAVLPAIDNFFAYRSTVQINPTNITSDSSNAVTVETFCTEGTSSYEGWRAFDYSSGSWWSFAADTRDVTYWGEWLPIVAGSQLGRWFNNRIRAEFLDESSKISVREYERVLDMPDLSDKDTVAISSGGTAVTFNRVFQVAPSLAHGLINGATGDTVDITSLTATGFTATVYDSSGSTKAGTLSYIVNGY